MKENRLLFFVLIVLSLAIGPAYSYGQADASIFRSGSIAEMEQKRFYDARNTSGNENTGGLTRTMASSNFDISYYRCEWQIDPNVRFIAGKVTAYFTITTTSDYVALDLSDTLAVDSITYHNAPISFQRNSGDGLRIQFASTLNAGTLDSVSIYYKGTPRSIAGFAAFVKTFHSGTPIIWTLSEPYGAKEWWPCKNGLDDKADSLDIIITCPLQYRASSNGILFAEDSTATARKMYFRHRYPIASYLLGVAVTNYVVIKDSVPIGARQMPLILTTYPEFAGNAGKINTNARNAFAVLNQKLGDYPFAAEQYGQTAWSNGGGMEHQTNSFITTTDIGLITHELGHQWFGDKITCGSWEDIWLNEGFATYALSLYYENTDKNLFYLERKYYLDNITAQPDGSVWVNDTTSPGRIFSSRLSYQKGSCLLHMLRWKVGDIVFFNALKRYLSDPLLKFRFARTADLKRNFEAESGLNLTSFFQKWFYGQGHPLYAVEWTADSSNNVLVKINQSTSHTSVSFYDMPVPLQFKNSSRDTIIVFNHTQNGQAFVVNPGFTPDTVIFDPQYWLLARSSVQQKSCTGNYNTEKILPHYTVQWAQNTNNWASFTVTQSNDSAAPTALSIPLALHFTGAGKDTAIEIKNTGRAISGWLNTGFIVTGAYISTSCLLNANFTLTAKNGSAGINEIKIFPVPATGSQLSISLKNPTDKQLSAWMYNAGGQLVKKMKFETPGRDELFTFSLSGLPKGIYIIRLQSELAIKTSRKITRL